MMAPIQELPLGYHEALLYVLTDSRRLLWLNIGALVPMLVALVWMSVWWVLVTPLRTGQPESQVSIPWWLGIAGVFFIVLPLHELLHGIAIQLVGHHARYGMKFNLGVLYVTADQALFRRHEYMFVALIPLVGITLIGMALMLIVPPWFAYYVSIGVVLNAGGAIGDLWSVVVLLCYPANALVRDEGDGFRIYTL
jgi:hypothetical protein